MTDPLTRLIPALAGHYRLERELGQGGMATVYLAEDLRHHRKVAIKVLRAELSAVLGPDRFLKEIEVTAGLQHPHILPLFDSGAADGRLYYVMPYVEGESLRARLDREQQLPIDDAVRIAREVAAALDYAHRRNVVHRDIKPENILLYDGTVMVVDFGIALAVAEAGGSRLTQTGMSLGTPRYMSPEQAMADREITPRSDIYALGCVVYEMLTGEPPFTGPTTQAIVARVMTGEPRAIVPQRGTVPPHVEAAVRTALARLPADRYRTAADFAAALVPGTAAAPAPAAAPGTGAARAGGFERRHVLAAGGVLLIAVAIGIPGWLRSLPEQAGPVVRVTLNPPAEAGVRDRLLGSPVALSPDGTVLVYSGSRQLFLRRLDQLEPVPLPNTQGAQQPFFSSDGQHVGFFAEGSLRRVALAGGPAVTMCPARDLAGATWGPEDVIVFAAAGGLYRVPAAGGTAEALRLSDTAVGRVYRWPEFLPDGKRLLVTLAGSSAYHQVGLVDLASGAVTPVAGTGEPSTSPHFVEPNWLLYLGGEATVFAVPFDWRAGRVTGAATPVLENVRRGVWGDAKLGLSREGWAVYLRGSPSPGRLTVVDRNGVASVIPTDSRAFSDPRFSPDGREVAVTVLSHGQGLSGDTWVFSFQQATLSRLTFGGLHAFPEWSADGRHVVFAHRLTGVLRAPAGGGSVDTLVVKAGVFEAVLTRDGRTMVYRQGGVPGDIYYAPRDSLDHPRAFLTTAFDERALALSPDDRRLAYVSNETGRDEVYVRPFPAGDGRWQISVAGGTEPRWRHDGLELFYRNGDTLFAVPVRTRPQFSVGPRTALFTGGYNGNDRHANYDVHPDGQRFVFVAGGGGDVADLILVQNLLAGLSSPAPARR